MAGKRSIFEDVGSSTTRQGPVLSAVGAIDRARGARRGIRAWLILLAVLVAAMVLVGGLTRLTDSGLSITEWQPVSGALPPMSQADWAEQFRLYQQTPQFRLENNAMTLARVQDAVLVGMGAPPAWPGDRAGLGRRLLRLPAGAEDPARAGPDGCCWSALLGGAQGAIGWWMVSSGLQGSMLSVASYRLATHLGLAFLILGVIAWDAFLLSRPESALLKARRVGEPRLVTSTSVCIALLFLQILLGALVAGIDAGRNYTDWP